MTPAVGPEPGPAIEPPDPTCWLHPGIEVRRSRIAGRGLFARVPIPAGTVVSRLGGRLVSGERLAELLAAAAAGAGGYVDTIAVDGSCHLVLPPGQPNRYGNHSCDPNLWWVGRYTLAARSAIAVDEEVTNDYATSTGDDGFAMTCRCATTLCRGTVTGADWRRPELRLRYGDHWVPVLLARIRCDRRDPDVRS